MRRIAVFAMQRSGHHSIIKWIAKNSKKNILFLNNYNRSSKSQIHLYDKDFNETKIYTEKINFKNFDKAISKIKILKKPDIFIYNIEEVSLEEKSHFKFLLSKNDEVFYVIRDPYNHFASRVKVSAEKNISRWYNQDAINMSISYYKEYLSDNNNFILYNKWYSSKNYRIELSKKIGLTDTSGAPLTSLSRFGPGIIGSSFDDPELYQNKANKMKVLNRWNQVLKNSIGSEIYKNIFLNNTILDLYSKQIFGVSYLNELEVKHNE